MCTYILHDYLLIVDEQKMKSHVYHVENICNLWRIGERCLSVIFEKEEVRDCENSTDLKVTQILGFFF